MAIGLLILLIMALGALMVRELSTLAGVVPDLADTALQGMNALEGWMVRMASKTPENIRPVLTRSVENFFSGGTSLLDRISTKLISMASGVVSKLPDSAFGIGTWLIACFMISAKLPKIRQWIHNHLPVKWHETGE
jgi:predicted PurR-regulated permease PerM